MDNLQRSSYWDGDNRNMHVNYERCNLNEETNHLKEERNIFTCCDTNLNFSTATCSEDEFGTYKKNKRQDPMSHRIIEKRRRDRMNNCLADLSRLMPTEYLKKGRGRIEKTEIIEMAIDYMKFLQQDNNAKEQYKLGYQECMSETMRFMVEVEGHFSHEAICVRLLNHLQKHCANVTDRRNVHNLPQTVPNNVEKPPSSVEPSPSIQDEYHHTINQNMNNVDDMRFNNNNHVENKDCNQMFELANYQMNTQQEDNECSMENKISYKYKTNIKLRFNQDSLNGSCGEAKRVKTEKCRRNSINSLDNRSLSHNSPPDSEISARLSEETTNRTSSSPSDSMVSSNNNNNNNHHLKSSSGSMNETTNSILSSRDTFSNCVSLMNVKNFKVPIFVLHSKGSFYVPLTIDYKVLLPYLHNNNYENLLMDDGNFMSSLNNNVVLHPVMINVNFQSNFNNNNNDINKCNNNFKN